MAEKLVTLTFNTTTNKIDVDPSSVTLDKDDWISFVATDKYIYTVIIDKTNLFNTNKSILKYEVYDCNPGDTPTTKPNPGPNSPVEYIVIATTSTNIIRTDPNAPPKIIIISHT